MSFKLTEDQSNAFNKIKEFFSDEENPAIVIKGSAGTGKCLGYDTSIIMYNGEVKMVQDIEQGEFIMGDDSTPRTVMSTATGKDEMYRVTTVKGDSYVINSHHILTFQSSRVIRWNKVKRRFMVLWGDTSGDVKCKYFKTNEEADTYLATLPILIDLSIMDCIEKNKKRHWREYFQGVYIGLDFPEKEVLCDPYFIGLWLGDGTSIRPDITTVDYEVICYLECFADDMDQDLSIRDYGTRTPVYSLVSKNGKWRQNNVLNCLKKYNLIGNKHIPPNFKFNSRENRLKLLAGLLDSDGSLTDNCYEITQKRKELSDDIYFVAKSLGFQVSTKQCQKYCMYKGEKRTGTYYRIHISGDTDQIPVLISRKKASPRKQIKNHLVSRISIEPIGIGDYYGFELDGNHRFVLGNFLITHNTYLTKHIVDYIMDNKKLSIVAVAPTHKARRVLSKMLNKERFLEIPSLTVASILGKMREHTYIGSHKYTNGSKQKMDRYDCFILDEVSMVADKDLDEIIDYICEHDKKLILIGDNCQIPAPSQQLVQEDMICYKPDSSAFEVINLCELRQIIRQAADSPIIRIATFLRDNLMDEQDLADTLLGSGVDEKEVCISHEDLYTEFQKDWTSGMDTRVIAYTNAAVRSHNQHIRKDLGYTDNLVLKELLTGYNNVGWPVPLIENGTDYKVLTLRKTSHFQVNGFCGLVGDVVDLVDLDDSKHISRELFFINIQHSSNTHFMNELVNRAEKVNQRYSTKNDYKKYCALKNRAVFLEDVYKYDNKVMTETNLRQLHPLLFTKVAEVIDVKSKAIAVSELTQKLEDQYGELVEGRLCDNKPFADAEVFADQYMVVEKDIYYGYSITTHKSQGSTYDSAYVDENDFKKISNKWNYKLRAVEQRHKERNQLKYVAYTRASKKLRIVI
jgi:hypothetical protein